MMDMAFMTPAPITPADVELREARGIVGPRAASVTQWPLPPRAPAAASTAAATWAVASSAVVVATGSMAVASSVRRARATRRRWLGRRAGRVGFRLQATAAAVDVETAEEEIVDADVVGGTQREVGGLRFPSGLAIVPPPDIRNRIRQTKGMLGKHLLSYMGDAVWEFLVLKHQYAQATRSAWMESQAARSTMQAKAASHLYFGRSRSTVGKDEHNYSDDSVLTMEEKQVLKWATTLAWRTKWKTNKQSMEQVGIDQYSAKSGLCSLLGYLYMDADVDDSRLEAVAQELGMLAEPQEEDRLLHEITGGIFPDPDKMPREMYFQALAPLGHCVLRLYISRYLAQRPPRHTEFIYRIKMALRPTELNIAAVGFLKDDATAEEVRLMKAAMDGGRAGSTYGFAFQCLLGHLALHQPYRLHQIIANFGWAIPLRGTV